jgi:hypothetical protein
MGTYRWIEPPQTVNSGLRYDVLYQEDGWVESKLFDFDCAATNEGLRCGGIRACSLALGK